MKNSKEMVDSLFERRERYIAERKEKRKRTLKISASVLSVCLVAALGIGLWQTGLFSTPTQTGEETGKSGDIEGGYSVTETIKPSSNKISFVGEKITDEEAKEYFNANYGSIKSSLSSSGVSTKNMKISDTGYCHINYENTPNNELTVRQDFRDYLVYSGDNLVSVITLTKENGTLHSTPTFGGVWLNDYNEFLKAHAGEELIFLYGSNTEIVIAPDGSYSSTAGYDVSGALDWVENPYEWFYNGSVVFIPAN